MSKARSMYAGSSGYNYGVNKNSPGNGNGKWQGLWPSVGHARNARHINIEAGGNNRNVVFCMNQLGGVGRISNMFATTADGVNCDNNQVIKHGGTYTPPGGGGNLLGDEDPADVKMLITIVNNIRKELINRDKNEVLVFVGGKRSLKKDEDKSVWPEVFGQGDDDSLLSPQLWVGTPGVPYGLDKSMRSILGCDYDNDPFGREEPGCSTWKPNNNFLRCKMRLDVGDEECKFISSKPNHYIELSPQYDVFGLTVIDNKQYQNIITNGYSPGAPSLPLSIGETTIGRSDVRVPIITAK